MAAFLLRAGSFRLSVIDPDEGLYLLQAREWLRGGWPLVATWDLHPVGGPAMVAIALLAFGESVVSVRLLGLLAVAATAWILYLTVRILGGPRAVGIGAGLLYIGHTAIRAGLSTNTELLFAPFTCAALAIGVHALRAQTALSWRSLAAMGLLLGWALTIKQVVVPLGCLAFALPMLPAYVRGELPLRRGIVMAAVFALLCATPTLAFALAYFLKGELATFLDSSFLSPMRYLRDPIPLPAVALQILKACIGLCWLIVLAVMAIIPIGAPRSFRTERVAINFALLWFLAGCVAVAGPLHFWVHYFLILVPPLSLLAAIGAWRLARLGRPSIAAGILACLVVAAASDIWLDRVARLIKVGRLSECCTLANKDMPDVPRLVAAKIAAELPPDQPIFVFNYQPIVYFLSRAAVPTRISFPGDLVSTQNFSGVDLDAELARVLISKPHFIVVDRNSMFPIRPSAQELLESELGTNYKLVDTFDDIDARVSPGLIELWHRR
ncbi:MAG: glycosyltransferase family 39 protein [Proteobacteria bacterium]|nr:glycosyltransferase family 39 protein [Pseudomonadota bacterium]